MNITSVESDNNWLMHLKSWDIIQHSINTQRLCFHHVDIGATGKWGVPLETDKKELFPNYSLDVFKQNVDFDMIFVDGRFRVACILASIMYCSHNAKIFVHDFNNREQYHKVLDFLDIVDTCDTLALLAIKDNIDMQELQKTYDIFKYEYQ